MARLINRHRKFTDATGAPLALGVVAVGDAHTCTNPLYGRGCSLGLVQATLLADAYDDLAAADPTDLADADAYEDFVAAAGEYERASIEQIDPWYRASVAQDRINRRAAAEIRGVAFELDAAAAAEPGPLGGDMPAETMRELLRHGLFPALRVDPVVFRAFLRMFNLLSPPDALLADWDVVGRVLQAFQDKDTRPPEPAFGPGRDEMLAALAR